MRGPVIGFMRPSLTSTAPLLIASILLLAYIGFATTTTQAQTGGLTWAMRTSMPLYQAGMGTATVNGKVYTVGGAANCGSPNCVTGLVQAYDTLSDTWTRKRDMPTPRINVGVIAGQDGKIYAIGGSLNGSTNYTGAVEVYDPSTDTWITGKSPMPTPRDQFGITIANDGKIYVMGGNSNLFGFAIRG
jgi:hypothetical protein